MEPWPRSDVLHMRMEGLVQKGLLRARTAAMEWIIPCGKDEPSPPDGYVVSFVPFHERGLVIPPYRFLRGLLHYYELELQHFESQWDSAHRGLRRAVRVVPRNRTPLRALKVLLR